MREGIRCTLHDVTTLERYTRSNNWKLNEPHIPVNAIK
jgi:hypothetical protein